MASSGKCPASPTRLETNHPFGRSRNAKSFSGRLRERPVLTAAVVFYERILRPGIVKLGGRRKVDCMARLIVFLSTQADEDALQECCRIPLSGIEMLVEKIHL